METKRMRTDTVKAISFSGIDGAGKSTQIDELCGHLRSMGFHPTVHAFWDDVVALSAFRERMSLKAFKGDNGVGSPEKPILRRDKNVTAWYMTLFRSFLYLLDALKLCVKVSRLAGSSADFVIFDRYIYDELANLPLHRLAVRIYIRLLLKFVPHPDLAIVLDAEPNTAIARKPEYPLEFAEHNREAYLRLSRLVGDITVFPPASVQQTAAAIRMAVSKKCLSSAKELGFALQYPGASSPAKVPTK